MTPKIIYIQQHVGDNGRKFTPSRNAHYVRYIGEREHVLKRSSSTSAQHEENLVRYIGEREHVLTVDKEISQSEGRLKAYEAYSENGADFSQSFDETLDKAAEEFCEEPENGLFGKVCGKFSDSYTTEEMQAYVRKMTSPHRNIFHSIFSFTPSSAEEAGLRTLTDWESWTKYHMSEIANAMCMKIQNIEYLAAVHRKDGQPHIHIMWWDKEQQVLINKVSPLVCDKIRIDVIKSTFRDEFTALHNAEDKLLSQLCGEIKEQLVGTDDEQAAKLSERMSAQILEGLAKVNALAPRKGQLKYGFMNAQTKAQIDNLTMLILSESKQLGGIYNEILDKRRLYNEMLHSSDTNYGKYQLETFVGRIQDDIKRSVGNTILRAILAMRKNGVELHLSNDQIEEMLLDELNSGEDSSTDGTGKYRLSWYKTFKAARAAKESGDIEAALRLYKEDAVTNNNALAFYEIADIYRLNGEKDTSERYYKTALAAFLEIEKTSSMKPYVQYRIGRMYLDGYGAKRDTAAALMWLKKSADGEQQEANHLAQYAVGKILLFDRKCRDTDLAKRYLRLSAESGNEYAKRLLDFAESDMQRTTASLLRAIESVMRSHNRNCDNYLSEAAAAVFGRGDLSKEAIAELIRKRSDRENTAEM